MMRFTRQQCLPVLAAVLSCGLLSGCTILRTSSAPSDTERELLAKRKILRCELCPVR